MNANFGCKESVPLPVRNRAAVLPYNGGMPHRTLEIAEAFARALDEEDYESAFALLSPDCEYRFREQLFRGPEAIVAEYRKNGEAAGERLESITYESAVRQESENTAVITFTDRLRHAGRRLVHRCEQRVDVDEHGRVRRIEHRDFPGEQEALDEFIRGVGPFAPD